MQATINYTQNNTTAITAKANAFMNNPATQKVIMFTSILVCLVAAINL